MTTETSFFSNPKEVLYHITSRANLPGILANGLCPSIGNNSALCRENDQRIYLTDEKSLPYWVILLNIKDPVLLKVSDISAGNSPMISIKSLSTQALSHQSISL